MDRSIRKTLYILKQQYGRRVDIYSSGPVAVDIETGKQTATRSVIVSKKTVVLQGDSSTVAKFSASYARVNRDFQQGGFIDIGARAFIFDARDLPRSFELGLENYLVCDHRRYEIKKISEFGIKEGFLAFGIETKTIAPNEINNLRLYDYIAMTDLVVTS